MNLESNILYESGKFYAYRLPSGQIEIRKNFDHKGYSVALGIAKNIEQAVRFINRAVPYTDNF